MFNALMILIIFVLRMDLMLSLRVKVVGILVKGLGDPGLKLILWIKIQEKLVVLFWVVMKHKIESQLKKFKLETIYF